LFGLAQAATSSSFSSASSNSTGAAAAAAAAQDSRTSMVLIIGILSDSRQKTVNQHGRSVVLVTAAVAGRTSRMDSINSI
jgi:hypothetical protein